MTADERMAAMKRRLLRGQFPSAAAPPRIVVNVDLGDFFERFATKDGQLRVRESVAPAGPGSS